MEKFLEGKGALITGGASGFGKGVALAFAERGADLVLVDINEELLIETSNQVARETGKKVIPIICDVSKFDQVDAMAKRAFNELDNIYVLFNNAGIGTSFGKHILRIKEADWDKIMNVNFKGQWLVAKACWRKMKAQEFQDEELSGKMIHTTSAAAYLKNPNLPLYSLSKVGIKAMVEIMAKSLAPKISVNAIAPGFHVTGIYLNDEETLRTAMRHAKAKIPLIRLGTIGDVVDLVVFIASPQCNYITGHCFPIDGGISEVGRGGGNLKWEKFEY